MPRLVYSPNYNINMLGLERLHPFDSRKYEKVWNLLEEEFGAQLDSFHEVPREPTSLADLARVHLPEHMALVQTSAGLAKALEVPLAAYVPGFLLQRGIVMPVRWAVAGTVLAAKLALEHRLAINLGGGFHHAKPHKPEGFCLFNDIAVAINTLRRERLIDPDATVAYIDVDAHQGNGVSHCFLEDRSVALFDIFNLDVYPNRDEVARDRVDFAVPLELGTDGETYLRLLRQNLPKFLDRCQEKGEVAIAFCNLGADVLQGDPLGALGLLPEQLVERDEWIVDQLANRSIPTATTTSGGYAPNDFQAIAKSITRLLERD